VVLISRKFVGTVIIVLCLGIVVTAKFPIGKKIRGVCIQGFRPVLSVSSTALSFVKNLKADIRINKTLRQENIFLNQQIKRLERKIVELKEYELENKRLKLLLNLKDKIEYDTIPAQVIGRDLSGWSQLIIIDKGTRDGLKENMPVVSGQGVVGKIIEVGLLSSKVQLLIDRQSRIGGIMQKSRLVGVIEGMGKNYLVINYLPRNESVLVNDLVLSSGLGLIFEKGLVIGSVQAVYEEKYSLYKYAIVQPAVEFDRLEEVIVILKSKEEL
jgi:rod shape-determining protein MreC